MRQEACDVHVALLVQRHGIEARLEGDLGGEQVGSVEGGWIGFDLAGCGKLPIKNAPCEGFGNIEALLIGGEIDAVGRLEWEDEFPYGGAIGCGVVDPGDVAIAPAVLAPVGEPEGAGRIEYKIVGAPQGQVLSGRVFRDELRI